MNVDEYIESTKKNNPRIFAAEALELTPQELERILRHAFLNGAASMSPYRSDMPDFFKSIFN